MNQYKKFFSYVIPSVLAFALSGIYAIVDGFFVGNSIGNSGLSTINIAYPVTALIQALGTGIGMGGAVCFSLARARKKEEEAREFVAGMMWLLLIMSVIMTIFLWIFTVPILKLLGANGILLSLGKDYLSIISLGTGLQMISTGLIPLIRNHGNSIYAMVIMILGFITNIILDYLLIWVYEWGTQGAALATIIGQGVAMIGGLAYLYRKKQIIFKISFSKIFSVFQSIVKIGIAPFGLALTPNFSLIFINLFSSFYGGEEAIACYACISYVISILYLVLQGIGDGSQPLMSQYYGEKSISKLRDIRKLAFLFSFVLSVLGIVCLFLMRGQIGILLGASETVAEETARIFPVFLVAIPFIAINRITVAGFYATEKSGFSYILTYIEPFAMFLLLLILPRFGGQSMIWWSAVLARIFSAVLALLLKQFAEAQELRKECAG